MRILATVALALAALTTPAFAEPAGPIELTDLQMDQFAAGGAQNTVNITGSSAVNITVNNVRIKVNGKKVVVKGAKARVIRTNKTTTVRVAQKGVRVNVVLSTPPN
jgi:P pilus assembly chaperone PapD